MSEKTFKRHWTAVATSPPGLTKRQWYFSGTLGVLLAIMAVSQILSIRNFEENFAVQDIHNAQALAAVLIAAELWAAAGFFKISLSPLFRKFSNGLALLVGLFWFTWQLYLVNGLFKYSGNFFGKFLNQVPGFWTVAEATVLLAIICYALEIMKNKGADVGAVTTTISSNKKRR